MPGVDCSWYLEQSRIIPRRCATCTSRLLRMSPTLSLPQVHQLWRRSCGAAPTDERSCCRRAQSLHTKGSLNYSKLSDCQTLVASTSRSLVRCIGRHSAATPTLFAL